MDFGLSGNIFDLIFSNDDADPGNPLQQQDGGRPDVVRGAGVIDTLSVRFPEVLVQPVVSERNIQYVADPEQMAAYHVPYATLLSRLKMLVNQNEVYAINEGARSLPVIIGGAARGQPETVAIHRSQQRRCGDSPELPDT